MRTSNIIILTGLILSSLLLSQCEVQKGGCTDTYATNYDVTADYNDGSCEYGGTNPKNDYCYPDNEGNLVINNNTEFELYLYKNGDWITCIPAYDTNFLVNIANANSDFFNLQILKSADIVDNLYPNMDYVYRQWTVALSSETTPEERATWLIDGSDQYSGTGTLVLNYPSTDEYGQDVIYQVDVYLNSKTGAKLASLRPGLTNKMVNVNYGLHLLYFRYWYSDPSSPKNDYTILGWNQQDDIVLNAQHTNFVVDIPIFESNKGKYGELRIVNNYDWPIRIYANGSMIENIAKIDDATQALSVIPANNYSEFLVPVENDYTIEAKNKDGSKSLGTYTGIDILQDEKTSISFGHELMSVVIENNTSTNLGLFNRNESYLGQIIPANSTSDKFYLPGNIDTVLIMDFQRSKKVEMAVSNSMVINSLTDYNTNKLTITQPWQLANGVYLSDSTIEHGGTTTMKATLFIAKQATFTFDYKVSTEQNFDKFNFLIDNVPVLTDLSGEIPWTTYSTSLGVGEYELIWRYDKDFDVSKGDDRVYIRNLDITK